MHDVLSAHRLSFLTLRLFEQVLEEVHRTALTAYLFIDCSLPFSSDLCMIVLADIAVIVVGY